RAPPVRAGARPRTRIPRRRDRGQPPPATVRLLQVRRGAVRQGAARPPHRPLPHALQPAPAPRPGRDRARDALDRWARADLPRDPLGPWISADRRSPVLVLLDRLS